MTIWTVLLAIAFGIAALTAYLRGQDRTQLSRELGTSRQELDQRRTELDQRRAEIHHLQAEHAGVVSAKNNEIGQLKSNMDALKTILEERKVQFPWLASAIADYWELESLRAAGHLQTKKRPAVKAAEVVAEHGAKRREAEQHARLAQYRAEYYEKLFPWIVDYVGDDVPDEVVDLSDARRTESEDPAVRWLTKAEFNALSPVEKYQKALDNWKLRRKSRWEIGREYERYVGYLYESQGFDVEYTGAIDGFADMGRDVIARNKAELLVIQCKFWSQEKVIREKHVFQLLGTSFEYAFRLGMMGGDLQPSLYENAIEAIGIRPILFTSTVLSSEARRAAELLNVDFFENAKISEYPVIKCNVSGRDGERIYHLPFDQQYDRTKIDERRGECFVYTVAEAERMGFRRAWRWHPTADSAQRGE